MSASADALLHWEDLEVGDVRTLWEMFNQHDEQVLHMEGWAMFRRRQPAA